MNDMNLAASSAFVGRVLLVSDDAIAVDAEKRRLSIEADPAGEDTKMSSPRDCRQLVRPDLH